MSEKSDWEQGYDQARRRFYGERKVLTARIAKLEAEIDQLTAHSDIERQDDKSSNNVATPIDVALRKRIAELGSELGRKSVELGELVGENILWKVINDKLKSSRENLERENDRLQEKVSDLLKRIAELEAIVEQLIWVGNDLLIDNANPVTVVLFNGLVAKAKEKERSARDERIETVSVSQLSNLRLC